MRDAAIREVIERVPAPAVGVTVFGPEGVRFRYLRGAADDALWDLASLTKVLVTLPEVLELCARGVLDLDGRLGERWARARGRPVGAATVRELLSHNAGLPGTEKLYLLSGERSDLVRGALASALTGPPGCGARYSDLGFLLLGEAVAELGGSTLDALSSRRTGLVFNPGRAVPTEHCRWRRRVVSGEVHDENAWAMGGVAGHAGAFGTLDTVTEAARGWLAGTAVAPALHEAALTCWSDGPSGDRFGLGWWLHPTLEVAGPSGGPGSYGHTGFVGNVLWCEPERGYGVLILSNRIHPARSDRAPFREWTHALLSGIAAQGAGTSSKVGGTLSQVARPTGQKMVKAWPTTASTGTVAS